MIICTLKNYMEHHRITQSALSQYTGITRPTLLQLIRNENQSIKYETIDQLCNFFEIKIEDLLLRSPIEISFKDLEVNKKTDENKFYDVVDKEEIIEKHTYYQLVATFLIDNKEYDFIESFHYDLDKKFDLDLDFTCGLEQAEYEALYEKGFSDLFFNVYANSIDFKNIIHEKLPTKLEADYFHLRFTITTANNPNFDYISSMLKDLPEKQLIDLKEMITKKINEKEFLRDLNKEMLKGD